MRSWAYGKELRGFLHAPSRRTVNSTLAAPSCLSSLCFGAMALWLGHVQAELSASFPLFRWESSSGPTLAPLQIHQGIGIGGKSLAMCLAFLIFMMQRWA